MKECSNNDFLNRQNSDFLIGIGKKFCDLLEPVIIRDFALFEIQLKLSLRNYLKRLTFNVLKIAKKIAKKIFLFKNTLELLLKQQSENVIVLCLILQNFEK